MDLVTATLNKVPQNLLMIKLMTLNIQKMHSKSMTLKYYIIYQFRCDYQLPPLTHTACY